MEHNHPIGNISFNQQRLTIEEQNQLCDFLKYRTPSRAICDLFYDRFGKIVKPQDINNLRRKLKVKYSGTEFETVGGPKGNAGEETVDFLVARLTEVVTPDDFTLLNSNRVNSRSTKYDHIESTLDTGASLSRYMKRLEDFNEKPQTEGDNERLSTARSTLEQLIGGVGEMDDVKNAHPPTVSQHITTNGGDGKTNRVDCPYLLLDIRDKDEYDACHVITARSYPIAMLSRSVNYESKEMLAYRNKPGRIIIVYDEDESISPRATTTLVQRGYANIFLLSGGLRLAWKLFPSGLIAGQMPETIKEWLRSRLPSATSVQTRLQTGVSRSGSVGSGWPIGLDVSRRTLNKSQIVSYCDVAARRNSSTNAGSEEAFADEDIYELRSTLDRRFDDDSKSTISIRSQRSSVSRQSSAFNGRKPFR